MTDITLDYYLVLMTNAQRTAWTPSPGTAPGPSGQNLLPIVVESDTGNAYYWNAQAGPAAWAAWPSGGLSSIANVRVLANISGGSAAPTANTLTAIIDACISGTQGDILYRNGTVWTALGAGTSGYVLQTGGAGANPSWVAAASSGALTQIATTTTTSSATSISFTSISGSYKDIFFSFYGRSQKAAAVNEGVIVRFNNDTAGNYHRQFMSSANTTVSASQSLSDTSIYLGSIPAATATANYAGQITGEIVGYSGTTFFKTISGVIGTSQSTSSGNTIGGVTAGEWLSTSAITRIDFALGGGNAFVDGTTCTIYGRG